MRGQGLWELQGPSCFITSQGAGKHATGALPRCVVRLRAGQDGRKRMMYHQGIDPNSKSLDEASDPAIASKMDWLALSYRAFPSQLGAVRMAGHSGSWTAVTGPLMTFRPAVRQLIARFPGMAGLCRRAGQTAGRVLNGGVAGALFQVAPDTAPNIHRLLPIPPPHAV